MLWGEKLEFKHIPVLLDQCIQGLSIKPNGIYVDGTLGGAGHSKKILELLSSEGKLIGIDRDEEALKAAKENLKKFSNIIYVHGNHDQIQQLLEEYQIGLVDGILLDLGVSSYQLDQKERGFSYLSDNLLDMRMDKTQSLTAKQVINEYSEKELISILYEYGEEPFAKNIVKNIVRQREQKPIETTKQLVEIIQNSIPKSKQKEGHPAKRTFQAIRIEVNNEIKPLFHTVLNCISCLKPKGRLCIITFHSLEDRAAKRAFIEAEGRCSCPKDLPYCICGAQSLGKSITKKPIVATMQEQQQNTRSKSAKLRIFEKADK